MRILIENNLLKKSRFLKYSLLASISVGSIAVGSFESVANSEQNYSLEGLIPKTETLPHIKRVKPQQKHKPTNNFLKILKKNARESSSEQEPEEWASAEQTSTLLEPTRNENTVKVHMPLTPYVGKVQKDITQLQHDSEGYVKPDGIPVANANEEVKKQLNETLLINQKRDAVDSVQSVNTEGTVDSHLGTTSTSATNANHSYYQLSFDDSTGVEELNAFSPGTSSAANNSYHIETNFNHFSSSEMEEMSTLSNSYLTANVDVNNHEDNNALGKSTPSVFNPSAPLLRSSSVGSDEQFGDIHSLNGYDEGSHLQLDNTNALGSEGDAGSDRRQQQEVDMQMEAAISDSESQGTNTSVDDSDDSDSDSDDGSADLADNQQIGIPEGETSDLEGQGVKNYSSNYEYDSDDSDIVIESKDNFEETAEQLSNSEKNDSAITEISMELSKEIEIEEVTKSIAAAPTTNAQHKIVNTVNNIIRNKLDASAIVAVAAGDEEVHIQRGLWMRGMYGINNQGQVNNINGYKGINKGATIGFDVEIEENIIGIAYSNVHSVFKFKNNKNNDKEIINSHVISIYGQKALPKNFVVQTLISASRNFIKDKTTYSFNNTKLKSNVKHRNHSYDAEGLLNYNYLTTNSVIITPNIGLRYGKSRDGVYNETGINVQEISLAMKENNILSGIIGTKVKIPLKDVLKVNNLGLALYGSMEHNFDEKTQRVNRVIQIQDHKFMQNYVVPKQPKTAYNLGASVMGNIKNTTISLEYNYYLNKHYQSHQGSVKLKVNI